MVIVTFKTIDLKSFQLEFPDTEAVADVKKKIAETQGEGFDVEHQKLVYSGKTLDDGQKLSDIKLDPKKFIVVMLAKKKPAVESAPGIVGGAVERAVPNRERIPLAGVPVTGVPITGIPLIGGEVPLQGVQIINLNELAARPGFDVLLDMARIDPAGLPEYLVQFFGNEQLALQMALAIQQNPQRFLEMLNTHAPVQIQAPVGGNAPAPVPGVRMAVNTASILNQADREAIQRIIGMGFAEPAAYEAYLVCDKNEVMAVNYILQQMESAEAKPNTGLPGAVKSGGEGSAKPIQETVKDPQPQDTGDGEKKGAADKS